MGKKVVLQYIQDRGKKNSCFSQRKKKLFGKANVLETLTNCRIIVIMQSECGNLYIQSQPQLMAKTQKLTEAWREYVNSHDMESQSENSTSNNWEPSSPLCDNNSQTEGSTSSKQDLNFHAMKAEEHYQMGVLVRNPVSESNIQKLRKKGDLSISDKSPLQGQRVIKYVSQVVAPEKPVPQPTTPLKVKTPKKVSAPRTPKKQKRTSIQEDSPTKKCSPIIEDLNDDLNSRASTGIDQTLSDLNFQNWQTEYQQHLQFQQMYQQHAHQQQLQQCSDSSQLRFINNNSLESTYFDSNDCTQLVGSTSTPPASSNGMLLQNPLHVSEELFNFSFPDLPFDLIDEYSSYGNANFFDI